MTHGPGVKNASRRAERFWPDDRRHKQSLGAVYTVSAVYMLGYQQIHQLVSVDFLFFFKRSSSGFPETQVCVYVAQVSRWAGLPYRCGQKVYFCPFLLLLLPRSHTRCRHITFPPQSHAVPLNRFVPVHISTFLPAEPAGTPGNARPRPVSACGNSSWRCRGPQSSVSQ